MAGFTIIEILVSMVIIAVLIALIMSAITVLGDRARKAEALGMVTALGMALESYRADDVRHRYPSQAIDMSVGYETVQSNPPRVLNALEKTDLYEITAGSVVDSGSLRILVDPWLRPVMYKLDDNMDKVADRPASTITDWNPQGVEPYGYVWSLGKPKGSDAADALPANAGRWIYRPGGR